MRFLNLLEQEYRIFTCKNCKELIHHEKDSEERENFLCNNFHNNEKDRKSFNNSC